MNTKQYLKGVHGNFFFLPSLELSIQVLEGNLITKGLLRQLAVHGIKWY